MLCYIIYREGFRDATGNVRSVLEKIADVRARSTVGPAGSAFASSPKRLSPPLELGFPLLDLVGVQVKLGSVVATIEHDGSSLLSSKQLRKRNE